MFNRLLIILSIVFLSQPWAPPKYWTLPKFNDSAENIPRDTLYLNEQGIIMHCRKNGEKVVACPGTGFYSGPQRDRIPLTIERLPNVEKYVVRESCPDEAIEHYETLLAVQLEKLR